MVISEPIAEATVSVTIGMESMAVSGVKEFNESVIRWPV
jgi:hypothetical protein